MYHELDALNSKLLALTAQFSSLISDINDLESGFIELSKEISDLSAKVEGDAVDVIEDDLHNDVLTEIDARALNLTRAWLRAAGYKSRIARVQSTPMRIWVKTDFK